MEQDAPKDAPQANAQAREELAHRANQVTRAEFEELVSDRALELQGYPKPARLKVARRLTSKQLAALAAGVWEVTSDSIKWFTLSDARIQSDGRIDVLFRLRVRPDVGYIVAVTPENRVDFTEVGRHAGVQAWDHLSDVDNRNRLLFARPIE